MLDIENPQFSYCDGALNVTVLGDIDHHCAKQIREKIDCAMFRFKPELVMLNLSRVEFMDSSGLGLILGRYNTACDIGADMVICSPSKGVMKILELAGIERIMKVEGDLRV